MHDLLEGKWAGKEGQDALQLFIELVGLDSSTNVSHLPQEVVKEVQTVSKIPILSLYSIKFSNPRNNRLLFQLPQRTIHLTLKSSDDLSFIPSPHKAPNLPVALMLKLSSQIV